MPPDLVAAPEFVRICKPFRETAPRGGAALLASDAFAWRPVGRRSRSTFARGGSPRVRSAAPRGRESHARAPPTTGPPVTVVSRFRLFGRPGNASADDPAADEPPESARRSPDGRGAVPPGGPDTGPSPGGVPPSAVWGAGSPPSAVWGAGSPPSAVWGAGSAAVGRVGRRVPAVGRVGRRAAGWHGRAASDRRGRAVARGSAVGPARRGGAPGRTPGKRPQGRRALVVQRPGCRDGRAVGRPPASTGSRHGGRSEQGPGRRHQLMGPYRRSGAAGGGERVVGAATDAHALRTAHQR